MPAITPLKSPPRYTTSPSTATAYGVPPTSVAPNRVDHAASSGCTVSTTDGLAATAGCRAAAVGCPAAESPAGAESGRTPEIPGRPAVEGTAGTSLLSDTEASSCGQRGVAGTARLS